MTSELDAAQPYVARVLDIAVAEGGAEALGRPQVLTNLCGDLLVDLPDYRRYADLLARAAEVGVAQLLGQQIASGLEPAAAVQIVGGMLSQQRFVPPDAGDMGVGNFAIALHYLTTLPPAPVAPTTEQLLPPTPVDQPRETQPAPPPAPTFITPPSVEPAATAPPSPPPAPWDAPPPEPTPDAWGNAWGAQTPYQAQSPYQTAPPSQPPWGTPPISAATAPPPPRRRPTTVMAIVAAAVVVVVIAAVLIGISVGGGGSSNGSGSTSSTPSITTGNASPRAPASASEVTGVPVNALAAASSGTTVAGLNGGSAVSGHPALVANGKPELLFIGAEYCPYCDAESWALVAALGKFGTFTDLAPTTSSGTDVDPNTPGFTFFGSTYASPYLTFVSVETEGRTEGETLQSPTPAQRTLWKDLDNGQFIPFIDIGNQFVIEGSTYDGASLANATFASVAAKVGNNNLPVGRDIDQAAGAMVKAICGLTNSQPSDVCSAIGS